MESKFIKKKNFLLIKGENGKGEAILRLEEANEWVRLLNIEYPHINHEVYEDEFSHLYFIKWTIKEKRVIKIII